MGQLSHHTDGGELTWRMTAYPHSPLVAVIPFLVGRGNGSHPAPAAPADLSRWRRGGLSWRPTGRGCGRRCGGSESPDQSGPLLQGWLPDLHQRRSEFGEPALKIGAVEELR